MAIGAKKITLPITNESTGTVSNVEYSFVQVDNTLATAGAAADAKKTGDEITDLKQDFNEYHPDLGSGYSAQLLSTVFIEDEVPYNFRTAGGSADIGDREYDEIVGVSMPVNQLLDIREVSDNQQWDTDTSTSLGNGKYRITFSGNETSRMWLQILTNKVMPIVSGHKYLIDPRFSMKNGSLGTTSYFYRLLINETAVVKQFDEPRAVVVSYDVSGDTSYSLSIYTSPNQGISITSQTVIELQPSMFDLTLMLGTAIADYVYGLEQSTAGSGVTWLRHHFPKIFDSGYIPYNAGEMQSVSGLSLHRMTGFNQWDEVWELGYYNPSNGNAVNSNDRIRSKNYVRILPNTQYYFRGTFATGVCYYDAEKNFISTSYPANEARVTPENAYYLRFALATTYGTTYKNDICLNLHWDGERDGEYEEYKEYVYPLDDSVVLRGKLELDSNNNLRANGDRYLPDGTVDRTWGEVDLGTQTWGSYSETYKRFYANISDIKKAYHAKVGGVVCQKYVAVSVDYFDTHLEETGIMCVDNNNNRIWVRDLAYTDSATLKTALSGVKLVYEKATATTETAEPYQTPQIVDDWGTEEYVSTSLVPVGHDTKYANNLRAKLEMSPDSPEEDGDYIVRHNNGENQYVALGSTTTIQGILDRLTALENA